MTYSPAGPNGWGSTPKHINNHRAMWVCKYLNQIGFGKGCLINEFTYVAVPQLVTADWRTCTDTGTGLGWNINNNGRSDVWLSCQGNKTIKIYDGATDKLNILWNEEDKKAVHEMAERLHTDFGVNMIDIRYVELVTPAPFSELSFEMEDSYTDFVSYRGWWIGDVTELKDGNLYLTFYDRLEPFKPEVEDCSACKTKILIRGSEEAAQMKDMFLEHARQFDVQAAIKQMKDQIWPVEENILSAV